MIVLSKIKKDLRKYKLLYLMILPVILYYILFCYVPMYGVLFSFMDYDPMVGFFESSWVGFKHFKNFFDNIYFGRLIKNTFIIGFSNILFGFPAPIIFALLLNEIKYKKFTRPIQTIAYLPHFVSLVVLCGMIKSFLGSSGFITQILQSAGVAEGSLLVNPEAFVPIYVLSGIWQTMGWDAIIYISALGSIDQQLYEAAEIDGAGKFRQLFAVTLPGILPTIIVMLILRMGTVVNVGYEKIILLYNDATLLTADVISSFVYRKGLQEMNWSYSTAIGVFNSIINIVFIVVTNKICKKLTNESLW